MSKQGDEGAWTETSDTELARCSSHASKEARDVGPLHVVPSRWWCCCGCLSRASLVAVRATKPVGSHDCCRTHVCHRPDLIWDGVCLRARLV